MRSDETAVSSGLLSLVDAHQHFKDLGAHYYPWLSDRDRQPQIERDPNPIRRNYLPPDYAADIAGADVRKTVHVENGWDPGDPVGGTRWLQGLAEKSGRPNAIVGYAELAGQNVAHVLDGHAAIPLVRGIRQILNWHEDPTLRVASVPDLERYPNALNRRASRGPGGLRRHLKIIAREHDTA
jgi:predicted TIM-barrel fold metal-dependent hydrolase